VTPRTSDDPEKTNTTYLEDSQPTHGKGWTGRGGVAVWWKRGARRHNGMKKNRWKSPRHTLMKPPLSFSSESCIGNKAKAFKTSQLAAYKYKHGR